MTTLFLCTLTLNHRIGVKNKKVRLEYFGPWQKLFLKLHKLAICYTCLLITFEEQQGDYSCGYIKCVDLFLFVFEHKRHKCKFAQAIWVGYIQIISTSRDSDNTYKIYDDGSKSKNRFYVSQNTTKKWGLVIDTIQNVNCRYIVIYLFF